MANPAPTAELLLASDVTAEEEQEVAAVFTQLGHVLKTRRALEHRGPDELEWIVLASLPLQAFLGALGSELFKDAYDGFKRLGGKLLRRKPAAEVVPLILQDSQTGLRIVLDPDLPAEAYDQLQRLDLQNYQIGPLHYDRTRKRWRSELDEAAP